MQRNTLFSETKQQALVVDSDDFQYAISKGDSARIDHMLAAKRNGAYLSLEGSGWHRDGSPLKVLLERGDFVNAGKLIAAGAETVSKAEVWVSDPNDCYPYGSYETQYTNIFDKICMNQSDIRNLVRGYLSYDPSLANELTANATVVPAPKP